MLSIGNGRKHVGCKMRISHVWPGKSHPLSLVFHSSILEPNFDCRLRKVEGGSQFTSPRTTDIIFPHEFLLQLGKLLSRKSRPIPTERGIYR